MTANGRAGFALAFEGCGCRAAFHVGVIEWLTENRLPPAAAAGASSGSLIAAAAAVGRVSDLRPVWTELFGNRICDLRRVWRGRWPFRMSEIVGEAATAYFGDRLMPDTVLPLSIVITELGATGLKRRTLDGRHRIPIARAILASCFIPGPYSRMVPVNGRLTFDGAWLGRVPIVEASRLGPRQVVACVSDDSGRLWRGALRKRPMAVPADLDYRVLSPVARLPVRTFDFDRAATLETFAIGRASAEAFVQRHATWLAAGRQITI